MVNVGFGMNEPHTIEKECAQAARRILNRLQDPSGSTQDGSEFADVEDIIGESLSRWGMVVMKKEIERFSRIIEVMDNPALVAPWSWNTATNGRVWYVYVNAVRCVDDYSKPFSFASPGEAVEWILAARKMPPQEVTP